MMERLKRILSVLMLLSLVLVVGCGSIVDVRIVTKAAPPALSTPRPTRTPTLDPAYKYPAPELICPLDESGWSREEAIVLMWSTRVPLAEDEWYEVQLWREGETPHTVVARVKEGTWWVERGGARFQWRIVIVRGREGETHLSPPSWTWSFRAGRHPTEGYEPDPCRSVPTALPTIPPRLPPAGLYPTPVPPDTLTPGPLTAMATPTTKPLTLTSYENKIVFKSDREEGEAFYVMNPDGSDPRRLDDETVYYNAFAREAISPDGVWRLEVREIEGNVDIYKIDVPGTHEHRITSDASIDQEPVWAPIAQCRIAFVSTRTGNTDIWTQSVKEPFEEKQLTDNPDYDRHPSWSPDGTQIVYWAVHQGAPRQIWVMNADGSNKRNVSNNTYNDWDPIWIKQPMPTPLPPSSLHGSYPSVERAAINSDGSLGPWQRMSSLTTLRNHTLAAVLVGDYVYALGGEDPSGETLMVLNSVERARINADGSLGPWQAVASMNTTREDFAAVTARGYIYALGGRGGDPRARSTERLSSVERAKVNTDGSLEPWQFVASMTEKRSDLAAVVGGEYLYAIGGYNGDDNLSNVERAKINADGSLGPWQVVTSMTTVRRGLAAVVVGSYLYIVGGGTGTARLSNIDRAKINADGSLGSWQSMTSMTMPRDNVASVTARGNLYAYSYYTVEWTAINSDGLLSSWHTAAFSATTQAGRLAAKGNYLYILGRSKNPPDCRTVQNGQRLALHH